MQILADKVRIRKDCGFLLIRCAYERNADSCGSGSHKERMQILMAQVCIRQRMVIIEDQVVGAKRMLIVVDQVRLREECVLLRIRYVYERNGDY